MICTGCGGDNPENARFCTGCGESLPWCAACGTAVAPAYRFCPGCGRTLASAAGRELSASDRSLARRERGGGGTGPTALIASSEAAREEERRQVAILFADLVGFTALSERHDPEVIHALMQRTLTELAAVVSEHGGHVDKFIGDCIMALFGAPVAHEDDVRRAVAAGLALQARLESINKTVEAQHDQRLAMRVGINAGLVVAGEIGRPGDYTVVGDAVNVASRIQGLARPGTVTVTEAVRAQADGAFTFAAAGTVPVRNRSAPVEIFEVVGVRATPDRPVPELATPFVGRERELARLRAALDDARAGRGSAFWLVAEAGIGKSRLVMEFAASVPLPALIGHCRGYAAPLYLPFRHWFEQLPALARRMGWGDGIDWGALLPCPEEFEWLQRALFPELAPPQTVDPETAQRVAHRALVQLLREMARRSPLLLIVEDLHWADGPSLELLEALAREAPRLPLMLLVTLRPDAADSRPGMELPLGPLEGPALEALLEGLLAPVPVSLDAARWLIAKSFGNPFFLEELTRSLQASHDLIVRNDRWMLARPLGDREVPDTVRGVVQARIDVLDPIARAVIREAAVLGTPFDTRVLQAITSAPGGCEEALETLEGAHILAPVEGRAPHRRAFLQVLVQQVAYETLLSRRRRELHERAAREIERLYAGRESEVVEELAEHYARAELRAPALRYLGEAAARAQSLYANDRARALYTRLVELGRSAAPVEAARYAGAVAAAECGLADLESLEGQFDAAIERMKRLIEEGGVAVEPVVQAGVRRRLALALGKRGEMEAAEAALAAGLALLEDLSSIDAHCEAARAWYQRAALEYRRARYEEAERALTECERRAGVGEEAVVQADCLLLRGLVEYDIGRRHEARTSLRMALQRKEAVGDLRGMAAALNNLGNLAIDEGLFAEAREDYSRALEIRQRIGHRDGIAAAEINLANVALSLGDWHEARSHLETAQSLSEEIGDAYGMLACAVNRGRLALESGDARDARRRLEAAGERARALEFTNLALEAAIGLAEAQAALGEPEKAMATAAAARTGAEAAGDPILRAAAVRAEAMAAVAAGRLPTAEEQFAISRRAFQELAQPLEEARTLVRWAAVTESGERAAALLDQAEPLLRALGARGELARAEAVRSGGSRARQAGTRQSMEHTAQEAKETGAARSGARRADTRDPGPEPRRVAAEGEP